MGISPRDFDCRIARSEPALGASFHEVNVQLALHDIALHLPQGGDDTRGSCLRNNDSKGNIVAPQEMGTIAETDVGGVIGEIVCNPRVRSAGKSIRCAIPIRGVCDGADLPINGVAELRTGASQRGVGLEHASVTEIDSGHWFDLSCWGESLFTIETVYIIPVAESRTFFDFGAVIF